MDDSDVCTTINKILQAHRYYPLSSNTFVSAHLVFRSGNRLLLTYYRCGGGRSRQNAAPQLRTWLAGMMEVKYVLGSQEAISEAGRLGGCRL